MLAEEISTVIEIERIPSRPPVIAPVAPMVRRPLWSVMIPTYNCLIYLQETLESVLAQDPGPAQMQVMVVDDCSTDGDVQALVQRVGQGRVGYYQQPQNRGSLRNFETCLNQAVGEWVHILHGDDQVAPGYYAEIEALFRANPEAGAAFTNTVFLTQGNKEVLKKPIASQPGILPDFLMQLAEVQQVETPAIVVKRSVYEQLGGFFAVHYGEDWEMWARIAGRFPVAYSPRPLARYRYLGGTSITNRSIENGQNVRDITRVIDIIQDYLPPDQRKKLRRLARHHYSMYCASLAHVLHDTHPKAAHAQVRGALEMSKDVEVLYSAFKFYLKDLTRFHRVKKLWQKEMIPGHQARA